MPAYHSSFIEDKETRIVGNFALLPFITKFKGPTYPPSIPSITNANENEHEASIDIIDECIELFRANSFFRNFTIDGPSDRTLIYGILYISDLLTHLSRPLSSPPVPRSEAIKIVNTLALEHFSIPGDAGFPLNNMYAAPRNKGDAELLRAWLVQFRQEVGVRVVKCVYKGDESRPSKWWMGFARRKFMNKSLS